MIGVCGLRFVERSLDFDLVRLLLDVVIVNSNNLGEEKKGPVPYISNETLSRS